MAQHPWLEPTPFFFTGGSVGVLLIHGFTGAPAEMRPLGEYLADRGYTVSGLCLPGHGTSVDDLAGRKWGEWVDAVAASYGALAGRCEQVFVAGLSLGGLLTLDLAARVPTLAGIILYSPALFVANPMMRFSWFAKWVPIKIPQDLESSDLVDPEADSRTWCYPAIPGRALHQVNLFSRRVRGLLPAIRVPTLVVMSTGDRVLKFESGLHIIEKIASLEKELVTLHDSGHNILVDAERESVWKKTADFITQRLAAPPS